MIRFSGTRLTGAPPLLSFFVVGSQAAWFFIAMLGAVSAAAADCPTSIFDQGDWHRLRAAAHAADAKKARAALPADPVFTLALALQLDRVAPSASTDALLIKSIPRSRCDVWMPTQLAWDVSEIPSFPADIWLGPLAKAVNRTKQGLREYLLMGQWVDGALGERWKAWVDWLRHADQKRFALVVAGLPEPFRENICMDDSCSYPDPAE